MQIEEVSDRNDGFQEATNKSDLKMQCIVAFAYSALASFVNCGLNARYRDEKPKGTLPNAH